MSDAVTLAESNDRRQHVPRLQMLGIRKAFGATQALASVDLEVRAGEVHALIGENGAGKSTLMKILSGALQPDDGQMRIDDQTYQPSDPREGRNSGVAMIYQELSLAPHLTVLENIVLGNEPMRGPIFDWPSARRMAQEALQQVGRPDLNPDTRVDRLSLAEMQLVEVARCVSLGCRILVLDEPTSSVTAKDIENLFDLIRRLREQSISVVYISHFLEEIEQISDRFTVIRDGQTVGTDNTSEFDRDEVVEMMVGRHVDDLYPRSKRIVGDVLLRVESLAGVNRPLDASFELREGEVLGIAGLIGAGRTEMLRAIFGLDPIQSGQVRAGVYSPESPAVAWQNGIGMVSEDRKSEGLALGLSIANNLTLPCLSGLGPWGSVLPSQQTRASQHWLKRLHVRCRSATQPIGDLSGGNQQKVAVARLLHADVDVLLLDEPTRGIDVGSKAEIYRLIDDLVANRQTDGRARAVLLISSYLPELLGICDRIAVMSRGRLLPARPARDRNEHEMMVEAIGAGDETHG